MYPFSFDEFLEAQGQNMLVDFKNKTASNEHLLQAMHLKLVFVLSCWRNAGGCHRMD